MNMRCLYISAFILLLFLQSCGSHRSTKSDLRARIISQFDSMEGTFAMAFQDLDDSTNSVLINGDEMFHAASTMKTPVMVEVFRQAEAGRFSLDNSILIKNEFRSIVDSSLYKMDVSEDSEGELYGLIGQKRTIRSLINDMITMSSNLATNILIEKVGAQNVTQTMRSFGADSILVLRGVEDIKAYEQGLSNRTTARDLMILFKKLGQGEAVSPSASEIMIEILQRQHFNDMIPALLPDSVKVAHKTGWITGVHHDSGLIILPERGKYVLVLLSKNAPDREKVIDTFAEISRNVYDYVINK